MVANVWKGQIRVEVCPAAAWKDAPFTDAPSTIDDFNLVDDDFDFGHYGKGVLAKNTMTCSFLAIAAFLLILFLLWRSLRACCVVCCCAETCDAWRKKHTDILWTKSTTALKVLLTLASLATMGLAGYSMSNLKVTLSDDAWKTVHSVKDTVETVLDSGDLVVKGLEETNESLEKVSAILQREVNFTEMRSNIQCLNSFLEDMTDLDALKTSISTLDSLLAGELQTGLENFMTKLDTLITESLTDIRAPVQTLDTSKASFVAFATQLNEVNDAATGLEPDYTNPIAAEDKVNELKQRLEALRDISDFLTDLGNLKAALSAMASSNTVAQTTELQSSIADTKMSISSTKSDLIDVEEDIQNLQNDYVTVSPCLTRFSNRIENLGQNVIEIPSDAAENVRDLSSLSGSLNDSFADDSSVVKLMKSVADIRLQMDLPETEPIENQLVSMTVDVTIVQNDAEAFQANIDDLIVELGTLVIAVDTLHTKLDTYLITSKTEANYLDVQDYVTLTFLPASTAAVTTIDAIVTDFSDVFDAANNTINTDAALLPNLNTQRADLSQTVSLIEAVPDPREVTLVLEDVSITYDALGSDPQSSLLGVEDLLDDVEEVISVTLRNATDSVQSASRDAKSALRNAREDSVDELGEFEEEKRNLTCQHFMDNPEDLIFALLAEDVNNKIYIVTLCVYCMTIVICLGLVLFVMVNCQFGIGMTLFLSLLLMVSYFLVAMASSTILIVENDFCANLEEMILRENSDPYLDELLRYYFTNEGSLRSVLVEAFDLDFADMESNVARSAQHAEDIRTDWGTKGELNEALNWTVVWMRDDLFTALAELEASFGFETMHPLYKSIKSYFCCDISSFLYTTWKDLTATGAVSLLVAVLGFLALHKIDRMPRIDCCGCSCRRQYLDEILEESEDISSTAKLKENSATSVSRKGTQIGTDVV